MGSLRARTSGVLLNSLTGRRLFPAEASLIGVFLVALAVGKLAVLAGVMVALAGVVEAFVAPALISIFF